MLLVEVEEHQQAVFIEATRTQGVKFCPQVVCVSVIRSLVKTCETPSTSHIYHPEVTISSDHLLQFTDTHARTQEDSFIASKSVYIVFQVIMIQRC